jgi:hypothetical protein
MQLVRMAGTISSTGFASGDRFVVGAWERSPIGPTVDVMWARPDGERVLLAPDESTVDFVESVYGFDRAEVVDLHAIASPVAVELRAVGLAEGELRLHLRARGPALRLPPRPLWFTRWVERPVARAAMGVLTWGTSPTGVQEWYQARACRFLDTATGSLDGRDLGPMAPLRPACGFGFSESPPWPSIVEVRPTLGVGDDWLARRTPRAAAHTAW